MEDAPRDATQSCAHWLSWRCGLDFGAAREKVRVARAIECLPKISAAMADGRLSYSKARALTRVATPAIEDVLLNVAFNGTTHHVEHWADGGATRLSNLATLCRFHHRAVHEGGLKIERCDDGALRFTNARGESLHACAPGRSQPLADWRQVPAERAERGIHIDAHTATTGWRGERMDCGVAIDSLRFRSAAYKPRERVGAA